MTNVTVLSGTLSDQPWNDYTFGQGIDAETGSLSDTAVNSFTITSASSYDTNSSYSTISDDESFQATFSTEMAGTYNMQGTQGSASAEFLGSISYSTTSMTIVAYYEITTNGYGTAPTYTLTADAANKASTDPAGFRDLYGDYFVANCKMGARFIATYVLSAASTESFASFKASIAANQPDVFTASGAASLSAMASSSSVSIQCSVFMEGVSSAPPAPSTDPSTIPSQLAWFQNNLAYVPRQAMLIHYSQINSSLPNTLPIDPQQFANVQTLGYLIQCASSSLSTLPEYYSSTAIYSGQQTFGEAFQQLNNTFLDSRGELPTNPTLTASLTQSAQDLNSALVTPTGVYAFYLAAQTLASTSGESSGMSGSDSATYGLTSTDAPVTLSTVYQNQNPSGHVGHRTVYWNWPFGGVDENQIVTGWYIHNVWGSTNGSWTDQNPLIGNSSGCITARSEYDRGLDWTLYVTYAEKSQFPWLS